MGVPFLAGPGGAARATRPAAHRDGARAGRRDGVVRGALQLRLVGPRAGRLGLGARRQSAARRGAPDRPSVPPPAAPLFGAAERRLRGGDPAALAPVPHRPATPVAAERGATAAHPRLRRERRDAGRAPGAAPGRRRRAGDPRRDPDPRFPAPPELPPPAPGTPAPRP